MHTKRWVAATLLAAGIAGCGEVFSAPEVGRNVSLALAVSLPESPTAYSVFSANVDFLNIIVTRDDESTAFDSTYDFVALPDQIALKVAVPLLQEVETLYVYIAMLDGPNTIFYASSQVILQANTVPPAPQLPLTYIGPGFNATTVGITPRIGFLSGNQNVQLTATAYDVQGAPVPAPIGWSVSDTRLATVTSAGLITGKVANGIVRVRALTPTGVGDSLTVSVSASPQVLAPPP